MLPAILAEDIRNQVLHYLGATFEFTDKDTENAFKRFLEDPENGLFKGPWITLKRPFRPAAASFQVPFDIKPAFHPFQHQARSWHRLASKGKAPQSTIVTTGTGSGKTECFLYPLLDHCLRSKKAGQKGIKAIVIYPMNALANDQEKRFAKTVWKTKELKDAGIRVGIYVSQYDPSDPGASSTAGETSMGEAHGISNQPAQQENPPDILLTNYKMLDFLLMRPQDQGLWRHNEDGVLRYLVLDELHTYDGAQGSDVACLVRRLKERLGIKRGELCAVGTSATIEDKNQEDGGDSLRTGKDALSEFVSELFEEDIGPDAIVGEDRLSVEEIVEPVADDGTVPFPDALDCSPHDDESLVDYVRRQAKLWQAPVFTKTDSANKLLSEDALKDIAPEKISDLNWQIEVGGWLKRNSFFKAMLLLFSEAETKREDPLLWDDLIERLRREDSRLRGFAKGDDRRKVLSSFLSLVAEAREVRSGFPFPIVPTQVQIWIRELRRVGRVVSQTPSFAWLDEPVQGRRVLPAFHCAECGESGWIALHDPDQDSPIQSKGVNGFALIEDSQEIYRKYFGPNQRKSPRVVIISPWRDENQPPLTRRRDQTLELDKEYYFCPSRLILRLGDGPCPVSGDAERFLVKIDNHARVDSSGARLGAQGCPHCGSEDGIFFIGTQAATICSVAIDEMFGSKLNSDPKLLAFTDSVQDASHRAGFFSSRTYNFTLRTALQHMVDKAGEDGVSLRGIGASLLRWWAQPGRFESMREAISAFLPPDLREYDPYLDFRESSNPVPPSKLFEDVAKRLSWQVVSEFGLMQTHGRTMERSGSAAIYWDPVLIEKTISLVREKVPGISPAFASISEKQFRLWLYGMLHRYRERGALFHEYLDSYARSGFWGKHPFGKVMEGRETLPPAGRYKAHLLVDAPDRFHDNILAPPSGYLSPWHLVWTRRALELGDFVQDAETLDLLAAFLQSAVTTGLFLKLNQDGAKGFYVISDKAAKIISGPVNLVCSETSRFMVRPREEAELWNGSRSIEYYGRVGRYSKQGFDARQVYYQNRYRKGALRRVVAEEHTGLLTREERTNLEKSFIKAAHADDPNVITCTSTLEMGIDIGDLSSTMLCAIPPTTANYLQRIGRAGRQTGTALIVSVVNQRPHDLFFYGRPVEMLKGRIEPPGCWLDAAAVLARQYLAFCFDQAVFEEVLKELPKTGMHLVEDLADRNGHLPRMMEWVTKNEVALQGKFLGRFEREVHDDTRQRFVSETRTEVLLQRIRAAADEFDKQRRELVNAGKRLANRLTELEAEDSEGRAEVEGERKIIRARLSTLDRTNALEILIDHGLLPNYAFPERGVRFYGAVYNKWRKRDSKHENKSIELVRGASTAIRELAPRNQFYTHSRRFEIQQIAVGTTQDPIIDPWAICGKCGHMRRAEELDRPGANPACPQCGYDGDSESQSDRGQRKDFIFYPRSQAVSYMEQYESLSADRKDERDRGYYQIISSYDQTVNAPSGAVADDSLPFGIEYRASMVLREVNVGYAQLPGVVAFGPGARAPDPGFVVCEDCGVVEGFGARLAKEDHRRSCSGRKRAEALEQSGRCGTPYKYKSIYLFRELKSEAIRLLGPVSDQEDVQTLTACLYLGLRLRLQGDPSHVRISPQVMREPGSQLERIYLVMMDAIPGGTGFLKALYEEKDTHGRAGEGVVDVLRRARSALENCACRHLSPKDDTDGCYRCLRTYHLQYSADKISRERGIKLLEKLLLASGKRVEKEKLEEVKETGLFESMLEKRFVTALERFVEDKQGNWEKTIIRGRPGFRFTLPHAQRVWDLELQPKLGLAQGVSEQCQPDFLLSSDDNRVKPIAIFTDGFEFHVFPNNALADDCRKRRSVLQSGNYHIWNVTWDDLSELNSEDFFVARESQLVKMLEVVAKSAKAKGVAFPNVVQVLQNGMRQLMAFLDVPAEEAWIEIASKFAFMPLYKRASEGGVKHHLFTSAREEWSKGAPFPHLKPVSEGDVSHYEGLDAEGDVLAWMTIDDAVGSRFYKVALVARLPDDKETTSQSVFKIRWRRFLAGVNLHQFAPAFGFWVVSESVSGTAPIIEQGPAGEASPEWQQIKATVCQKVRYYIDELAAVGMPLPAVEYYNDDIDDDAFAELAWVEKKVAILAGEQTTLINKWQRLGWRVVVVEDLQSRGVRYLIDMVES